MSQAHIPQPDANAPGEQIASTDTVLPMASIETMSPSTSQEVGTAMGEFNTIDQFFYTQFRQIAKIRWTVQDVAGKLLWYVPINPLSMDENLAYLSRMYLAWAGDFIFNFKVAGTGFHAGMLTFVKTPPTVHPSKLTHPQHFTIMPWDAVDPKMLEIGSMYGRDIRPIKYHYTQKQDNAPDDYYIGGYLALFVDIPLNTSSSGTPRIEIAIWVKNAPNYRVAWMVPYSLQDVEPPAILPNALINVLKFSSIYPDCYLSSYPTVCDKILFLPSTVKVLNKNVYSCATLDQKPLSKYYTPGTYVVKDQLYPSEGILKAWTDGADASSIVLSDYMWMGVSDENVVCFTTDDSLSGCMKISSLKSEAAGITLTGTKVSGKLEVGRKVLVWVSTKDPKDSSVPDNEYKALTDHESFMVFAGGKNNYWCPQFYELSRIFCADFTGLDAWLPPGQSAIFQVVETSTQLPLTFCKLYRTGFFTVPATTEQMVFDFQDIELKYMFQQPETAIIPANINATNMRMAAYYHKRRFKHKK